MKISARHTHQGFSLIEIMVVILIIGIIMGIIALSVGGGLEKGKKAKAEGELRVLKYAIERYDVELGDYPQSLDDLVRPPADEKMAGKWQHGGYFGNKKAIPKDPWKNKYQYQVTPDADEHPFELYSYGPKGKKAKRNEYLDAWNLE